MSTMALPGMLVLTSLLLMGSASAAGAQAPGNGERSGSDPSISACADTVGTSLEGEVIPLPLALPVEGCALPFRCARPPGLAIPDLHEVESDGGWLRPVLWIGGGALIGAAWGTYLMWQADDGWIGPPAHILTVPVGAAGGGLLYLIFDR